MDYKIYKLYSQLFYGLVALFLFIVLMVVGTISANAQQSPLDRWYEEESITNRGKAGNAYNTQVDEYYIDSPIQDYSMQGNGNCQACSTPNPPWWCFEPDSPCADDPSVPIDGNIFILLIGGALFGAYAMRRQLQLS